MEKISLFLLCLFFSVISLQAQPAKDLRYYEKNYPESKAVEISRKQSLHIEIVNGKPEIYYERYIETMLLTDMVSGFANEQVYYNPIDSLISIEAWSLIPYGNKYKKVPVKEFIHSSSIDSHIFYDDTRTCRFVFPGLTKGSKTVLKYRNRLSNPYFIPKFLFSNLFRVEESEITFEYDNKVELIFKEIGYSSDSISTSVKKDKKKTVMRQTMTHIPSLKFEKYVNNYIAYLPQIIPRIASYKPSETEAPVQILPDLKHLHQFYLSFSDSIKHSDDSRLLAIADSITSGSSTELDKVKAIYYWVQHNIRYVAIEDGDKGVVPAAASVVYEKRYGDCKGMANLIHVLLKEAGITSYLTWVGTTIMPYRYTEIPSPVVDNHMITCYFDKEGKCYFLDATSEFQSIDHAPSHIQGKECLISISRDSFRIVEVPYHMNRIDYNLQMEISGQDLKIVDSSQLAGEFREEYAYRNAHKTEEEIRKAYLGLLEKDGYAKSTVYKVSHSNLYAVDNNLQVNGNYTLHDFVLKNKDILYVKLFLRKLTPIQIESDRKYAFELEDKQHLSWKESLQIPEGYAVDYLPENVSFSHPLFSFSARVSQSKDKIIVEADYITDFIRLPQADQEQWNEMNRIIQDFINQSFVLKKQ